MYLYIHEYVLYIGWDHKNHLTRCCCRSHYLKITRSRINECKPTWLLLFVHIIAGCIHLKLSLSQAAINHPSRRLFLFFFCGGGVESRRFPQGFPLGFPLGFPFGHLLNLMNHLIFRVVKLYRNRKSKEKPSLEVRCLV